MKAKKTWILYDGRACGGLSSTDDAAVLVACDSNKEAKSYKGQYGTMACYSYKHKGRELVDEQWEWDWHVGEGIA